MLVLVGDAEPEYGEFIGELLRRQSHRVVLAASVESCRRFLDRSSTDLIVVSSSISPEPLPNFVQELSRQRPVPIIALLDDHGPSEVAECFAAGADDCLRKPFYPSEFAARVGAVVRRSLGSEQAGGEAAPTQAELSASPAAESGMVFDHRSAQVFYEGRNLNCTQLEYQILSIMAAMDGGVVSHAALNERIWGYSNLSDGTLLKGHVSSIRRKLAAAGFRSDVIRTVYGVGYALAA